MDWMVFAILVLGLVLLVVGAEWLVRGASRLATAVGISPLVVGLTVVAFGTSSPELAVTIGSAYAGNADVAVGNVVGSNIFNVLFILGLSALLTPLVVARQLVRIDMPLVIAASVLVLVLGLDGRIGRLDGLLLFTGVVVYTAWLLRQSRREQADARTASDATEEAPSGRAAWLRNVGLVVVGLVLLVTGARMLVDGAVQMATALGVSELVIGLTIVAVGTSLPEVATSVLAGLRGERDIAVGNVVGSSLFNLLVVLGLGSLVAPGGVEVSQGAIAFDIPVMIAVAVVALPIFFTGYAIERWEGALLLGFYFAYVSYLVMEATTHAALPHFSAAMAWFVLPLTGVTLLVLAVRALRGPEGRALAGSVQRPLGGTPG
jgi:cation:H+ antiporter